MMEQMVLPKPKTVCELSHNKSYLKITA